MPVVNVSLGERSYPISIGTGIFSQIGAALDSVNFPRRIGIVTNPTVGELYGEQLIDALVGGGRKVNVVQVPDGEQYKTLDTLGHLYDTRITSYNVCYTKLLRIRGLMALVRTTRAAGADCINWFTVMFDETFFHHDVSF